MPTWRYVKLYSQFLQEGFLRKQVVRLKSVSQQYGENVCATGMVCNLLCRWFKYCSRFTCYSARDCPSFLEETWKPPICGVDTPHKNPTIEIPQMALVLHLMFLTVTLPASHVLSNPWLEIVPVQGAVLVFCQRCCVAWASS